MPLRRHAVSGSLAFFVATLLCINAEESNFCGATSAARAFTSPPVLDQGASRYESGELILKLWLPEDYSPQIQFLGARDDSAAFTGRRSDYWEASRDRDKCRRSYTLKLPWDKMNPGGDDLAALKVVESSDEQWLWLGRMQVDAEVELDLDNADLAARLGKDKVTQKMEWMIPFKIDFPRTVVASDADQDHRILPMTPVVYAAILAKKRYDVVRTQEGERSTEVQLTVIHSVQYPFRAVEEGVQIVSPGSTGYATEPEIKLVGSTCREDEDYREGKKDIGEQKDVEIKMCVQQWEISFVVNSCSLAGDWMLTWNMQCVPRSDSKLKPLGCVYSDDDEKGEQMSKPAVFTFKLTDDNLCVQRIDDIQIDSMLTPYQSADLQQKKLAWVNGQQIFFESSMSTNAANFKSSAIIALYGQLDANGDGKFDEDEPAILVWDKSDPYNRNVDSKGVLVNVNKRYYDRRKRDDDGWSSIKNKFELTLNDMVFPPPTDMKTSLLIMAEVEVEYRGGPTSRRAMLDNVSKHRESVSTVITLLPSNSEAKPLSAIHLQGMIGGYNMHLVIAIVVLALVAVILSIYLSCISATTQHKLESEMPLKMRFDA